MMFMATNQNAPSQTVAVTPQQQAVNAAQSAMQSASSSAATGTAQPSSNPFNSPSALVSNSTAAPRH